LPQLTIRFREAKVRQIREAAGDRGFVSPTAFMRHAVDRELADKSGGPEQRIAATLERLERGQERQNQIQQTLFAFVDTLAKAVLTALPEQNAVSRARARERYDQFLKSAAEALVEGGPPGVRN